MSTEPESIASDLITSLLTLAKIDYSNWGTLAGSKPLTNLVKEVENKETKLSLVSNTLLRLCRISYVIVRYKNLTLVEEKTVWKDGRPPRVRLLPGSIAEKALSNESEEEAAVRGLKEELGLSTKLSLLCVRGYKQDSPAYPGLPSFFADTIFEVELSDEQYVSSDYVENDNEKKTFFVWKPSDTCNFPEKTIIVNQEDIKDAVPPGYK